MMLPPPEVGASSLPAASHARVAIVSDAVPGRNGVGTYYRDLIAHLEGRVEHIEMLCPNDSDGQYQRLPFSMPGDETQRFFLPRPIVIARRLREIRPHLIVAPTPGPFGLYGFFQARQLGLPVCVGYHTQYEELARLYWEGPYGSWTHRGVRSVQTVLFRSSDFVAATNAELADDARHLGAADVRQMGTFVDARFLRTPLVPPRDGLRRILFVGRLAPEKSVHAVLEAAEAMPHLQFVLAGDGPLRAEVESAAGRRTNVHYLGWIDRADIVAEIDRSDVLVLPSRLETFGTAALEAMARGRLALVSAACGIRQWPRLASGVVCIGRRERVSDALGRLEAMPSAARDAISRRGHEAATHLQRLTADQWLSMISMTIGRAAAA